MTTCEVTSSSGLVPNSLGVCNAMSRIESIDLSFVWGNASTVAQTVGKWTDYTQKCKDKGGDSTKLQDCLSALHLSRPDCIVFDALGVKEGILATAGRDEGLKRYRNGFRKYLTFILVILFPKLENLSGCVLRYSEPHANCCS